MIPGGEIKTMEDTINSTSREYWTNVIRECNESGMAKTEWMNQHNINQASFYRWQRILSNEEKEDRIVCLEEPVELKTHSSVIISKKDIHMEISEDISDALLLKVMRALKNA